jgi:menaquinone-dependent protoporphyrinogen oxidase
MESRTLIIYHSTDGHTIKISKRIAEVLNENSVETDVIAVGEFDGSVEGYDQVVIASSIRYGKHHRQITDFIDRNLDDLQKKNNAFISVNLIARKPEKRTAETNKYVSKFLANTPWKPDNVFVFAGNLDYPKYSFFDRIMIQLIMKITGGPTDPKAKIDFTDWTSVTECAQQLALEVSKQEVVKEQLEVV